MPLRDTDVASFLPLTPLVFQVLIALADEPRHGYGILREIEMRTGGLIRLGTGTLYVLLRRLREQQLIDESSVRPSRSDDDERRRYYALTERGRAVMRAEAERLRALLAEAKRKHVFGKSSRA